MEKINLLEKKNRPWVIAHRGYRSSFPENTFCAFEAAIEVKADMIELDVSLSRDRVPVVIHDKNLDRTTDGEGLVADFSISELKKLDAGSWFNKEFKGEKIPTLEETLDLIKGRINVNIEIKPESFEISEPIDAIEIQVCKLIERLKMEDEVIISSFEHSFFSRIQNFCKKSNKLNFIRLAPLLDVFQNKELILSICRRAKAYSFHPNSSFLTESLILELKAAGYKIFPYTINENYRMKELIKSGVSGIITDEPEKLRKLIEKVK